MNEECIDLEGSTKKNGSEGSKKTNTWRLKENILPEKNQGI